MINIKSICPYFFVYILLSSYINTILCIPVPMRRCAKLYNSISPQASAEYDENGDISKDLVENTTYTGVEQCTSNFCYSLWREDENGTLHVMGQGCWVSSDKEASCYQNECISHGPSSQALSYTRFCCCSGDLCNKNMSTESFPLITTDIPMISIDQNISQDVNFNSLTLYISIILATILFLITAGFIIYKYKSQEVATYTASSGPGYSSNLYNVDNLKLVSMVGKGRYGTVWRGSINEEPVAVKIFPAHHRNYFLNERDLYCLPMMSNPSLLTYYGCDERSTMEGIPEYLLVLSLETGGCLQDYLKNNILPWDVYCSMAQSIVRGIAHLHTDIRKGDLLKPCICHRDINSRNVLVKSDLTCCICDLGFAVKTWGPRYEHNGEQQLAETRSINEVGTLRYMSPEILEGAVNLRDCESALKQIDIYALGLVLWELSTRCSDFYPANFTIPEYCAPFEKELPSHPSFEQMQVMVCRHKTRPVFPPGWGCINSQASKLAKETCEDCWDHDAEARLTALCVEERLFELASIKPNRLQNTVSSPPLDANNLVKDKNGTMEPVHIETGYISDKNTNACPQMQAFQGRNPCLERNLMASDRYAENTVLIERSLKDEIVDNFNAMTNDSNIMHVVNQDISAIIENRHNYSNHNEQARNNIEDALLFQTATPIPYLQNVDISKLTNVTKTTSSKSSVWQSIKNLFDRNKINIRFDETVCDEKSNLVFNGGDTTEAPTVDKTKTQIINALNNEVQNRNYYENSSNDNCNKTSLNTSNESSVDSWSPKVRPNSLPLDSIKNQYSSDNSYIILGEESLKSSPRSKNISLKQNLNRQHSLEIFHEVFSSTGDLRKLRDPSQRVKTPGDVPPSVRRARSRRSCNRLSLYDDRMMVTIGHSL